MGTTSCYARLFRTTPLERIQVIRRGLPAACVIETSKAMGVSPAHFLATLQLRPASVNRCLKANVPLSAAYSERIVGLYRLIGQVELLVADSGDPAGFNAARWLSTWMEQPLAALGNAKPAAFMDTMEGQRLVSGLLARMASGAYA